MWMVGVDEAGRGPVLGPLVVVAAAIPEEHLDILIERGVKDSKDLTHKKRMEIVEWFLAQSEIHGWKYSTIICQPERIDHGVQTTGLNLLEVELFAEVLVELYSLTNESLIVMNDACDVNEKRFSNRIIERLPNWPWKDSTLSSEHKADTNHPVVGMASILAKVERDRCIEQLEQKIGLTLGSGYPSDPKTKSVLNELLQESLPHPELRWSWKTVARAWKELYNAEPPKRVFLEKNQTTLFGEK